MKQLDKYNRICGYLNKIFNYANEYFFDNRLELPVITLVNDSKSYGHISTSKVWKKANGESQYELNISSYYLNQDVVGNRDLTSLVVTMLHEMSHEYLMCVLGDLTGGTSNRGIFHNGRFKKVAEEVAKLKCTRHEKYGFCQTEATEETLEFMIHYNLSEEILLNRDGVSYMPVISGGSDSDKPVSIKPKTKSNSRKWVCPSCGLILRSTRDDVNVQCLDCHETLVRA